MSIINTDSVYTYLPYRWKTITHCTHEIEARSQFNEFESITLGIVKSSYIHITIHQPNMIAVRPL